jgi:hypothetical protein
MSTEECVCVGVGVCGCERERDREGMGREGLCITNISLTWVLGEKSHQGGIR